MKVSHAIDSTGWNTTLETQFLIKPEDFEEHTFYNPRTGQHINVSGNQELEMSWKNTPGTSILILVPCITKV